MNNSRRATREAGELLKKISELSFVRVELELYLDTHPDCKMALDMYYKTLDELKMLTETYKNTVGPLIAADTVDMETWSWVNMPWPWQEGNGAVGEGR